MPTNAHHSRHHHHNHIHNHNHNHHNNNQQQTTNSKQQTTNDKRQTTNNKRQTTNNKQPQTNEVRVPPNIPPLAQKAPNPPCLQQLWVQPFVSRLWKLCHAETGEVRWLSVYTATSKNLHQGHMKCSLTFIPWRWWSSHVFITSTFELQVLAATSLVAWPVWFGSMIHSHLRYPWKTDPSADPGSTTMSSSKPNISVIRFAIHGFITSMETLTTGVMMNLITMDFHEFQNMKCF